MAIQYAGGTNVNATFTGASRSDIQSNIATQLVNAGWSNVAYMGGGVGIVGTFTVTIASPGVVTKNSHGLSANDVVILQTTGALPTGLSVNTRYFVRNPTANTFELSATAGGASINTSGSQSGTHTLNSESFLLQSAATPQGLAIRVRLKDNRGNCIQFSLENTAGTLAGTSSTSAGGNLLPAAAKTFRIIANKYQFFCFVPGTFTTARNMVAAGVPYIPSPLTVPAEAGWLVSDGSSDTSTTAVASWRIRLGHNQNQVPNMQMMWASTLWEISSNNQNTTNCSSAVNLVLMTLGIIQQVGGNLASGNPTFYRWANDDIVTSDPLLAWGLSAFGDEPKLRCQMWDALIIHDSISGDTTTTFDGKSWFCLTDSNGGSLASHPRGSLFLVIP